VLTLNADTAVAGYHCPFVTDLFVPGYVGILVQRAGRADMYRNTVPHITYPVQAAIFNVYYQVFFTL
jgi:hypothetical protein